jgi:glyoxylase-like metal-dependent hydrolase (beta-lactamase superfamily II)
MWIAGALVGLLLLYGWLFIRPAHPEGDWAVDLGEVRRLAQTIPGDKVTQIRVERPGRFKFPGAVIRAGDGWGLRPMELFSYQLVFPKQSAIVDTAMSPEQAQGMPGCVPDPASFDRISAAMSSASLIVVTHEHGDHLGGLIAQKNLSQLLKVAKLNPEQVSHPERIKPATFPEHALDGYTPAAYEKYLPVAPGVVLVRAAGHTPGSQLVYVQRADGTEYLFLGDVAWHAINVESERGRPRAVAAAMKEDRGPVARQLEQLHALSVAAPKVHQVPGHDPAAIDQLVAQHLLDDKFM